MTNTEQLLYKTKKAATGGVLYRKVFKNFCNICRKTHVLESPTQETPT